MQSSRIKKEINLRQCDFSLLVLIIAWWFSVIMSYEPTHPQILGHCKWQGCFLGLFECFNLFEVECLLICLCVLDCRKWQSRVSGTNRQKTWRVDNNKDSSDLSNDADSKIFCLLSLGEWTGGRQYHHGSGRKTAQSGSCVFLHSVKRFSFSDMFHSNSLVKAQLWI